MQLQEPPRKQTVMTRSVLGSSSALMARALLAAAGVWISTWLLPSQLAQFTFPAEWAASQSPTFSPHSTLSAEMDDKGGKQ